MLILFDVDGTLVKSWTTEILHDVRPFFEARKLKHWSKKPKLAICTNQGGVGLRYWLEQNGGFQQENVDRYPTEAKMEAHLGAIVRELVGGWEVQSRVANPGHYALFPTSSMPVYVAYAYRSKAGEWGPTPRSGGQWSQAWRKPAPGMIHQAVRDALVAYSDVVFVGDSMDDWDAAKAAGVKFVDRSDFFMLGGWRRYLA